MKITVLVGNPGAKSRTLALAQSLAEAIVSRLGLDDAAVQTIDLADHASELFDWGSATVSAFNTAVAGSDLVLVASPTYKAAYTGMLKAFLDRYDTNGLAGVIAIPVMTGGSPAHMLAPDTTLRPLLVELGASVPTRSLYVMTSQLDGMDAIFSQWLDANERALAGALRIPA
ncbi:NAD(P)H-dependent oxidoreductase [Sphingomonas sp. CGMCC 1.13654]|uniref:NAD(P)H-dependent oxidoreductase n=1 Tax=Sphingomonas chungangi TaxID=2683589 RepID=A0A838L9J7_9SPHN|nr:NAD(P)H-dependent oxidoreductase [Sphingomonas chungangi]MBA2934796.1 NAD(P)H-dependent oxidoreductase [Sphingomonas chungangi]MVW58107.1 NADPH-dependent oxidoreductase [Sphingomonas chungangi]